MATQTKIYKASAGSGKTFRLAVEYLKLILKDKDAFKSILAVTFTNKATAEMKERILFELYGLYHGYEDSNSYRDVLIKELGSGWNADKIKEKAGEAITAIIHDYSRFRIETIDSFFQSILRNLIHELEIGAIINLELDNTSVVHEAVNDMMNSLHEDDKKQLLKWLTDFSVENLRDGKSWRVNSNVEKFATNLFKEDFITKKKDDGSYSIEKLTLYRDKMKKILKGHVDVMKDMADEFFVKTDGWNAVPENFYYGTKGLWGYFSKIKNGDYADDKMPNSYVQKSLDSVDNVESKKSNPNVDAAWVHGQLNKIEDYRNEHLEDMCSCETVLKNINNIGLLYDIESIVRHNNEMTGKFLLGDTAVLLNKIIDKSTAPFIYEKIGTTLRHIMIDEFQDTSKIQWENFLPLLSDSVANGGSNLIVGDPKQSIYRWRNGDYSIIENVVKYSELYPKNEDMDTNYRSFNNVIKFNNAIFKSCIPFIPDGDESVHQQIQDIYDKASQKSKDKGEGYVKYQIVKKEEGEKADEAILRAMVEQIKELKNRGIEEKDIAILVRKNGQTAKIAKYLSDMKESGELLKDEFNIVSSEAFRLDNSLCVNVIINALCLINDPSNDVYEHRLYLDYINISEKIVDKESEEFKEIKDKVLNTSTLPLYEMIEEIYFILDLEKIENNGVYMQLFLDKVNTFINRKSSDLTTFIKYWNEKLCGATLSSSNESNGMRVLTVHKSKGLEFKTVIIPFADWEIEDTKNDNILWCEPNKDPYNDIPLLPINYNKNLKNSIFKEDYDREKAQMWIDNINLLYVAFTRAEANLIIFSPEPSKSDVDGAKKINSLLSNIFTNKAKSMSSDDTKILAEHWNEESLTFEYGELSNVVDKKKTTENTLKKEAEKITLDYVNYRINSEGEQESVIQFRQSDKSKIYLKDPEKYDSKDRSKKEPSADNFMEVGKLKHAIFSDIHTIDDVEKAVKKQVFEGVISKDKMDEYTSSIRKHIESAPSEWFDKSAKVINERSILMKRKDENGKIIIVNKRPDRIVLVNGKTIIVDFKFGEEHKKYNAQIREYAGLMRQMGYSNVEAYLWYVEKGEIEKC